MRLHSIRVRDFRCFTDEVAMHPLGDGLNIVSGQNESGKSTLLDALFYAFFERHRMTGQQAESILPRASKVQPQVQVEFACGESRYTLTKRFVKQPEAELKSLGGPRFIGDDAEEKLAELLSFSMPTRGRSTAPLQGKFGLLWVRQTESYSTLEPSEGASADIRKAMASELQEASLDEQSRKFQAEMEEAYHALVDRRGRPRGAYLEAQQRVAEARRAYAATCELSNQFSGDVARLDEAAAALAEARQSDTLVRLRGERDAHRAQLAALEGQQHRVRQLEAEHRLARAHENKLREAREAFTAHRIQQRELEAWLRRLSVDCKRLEAEVETQTRGAEQADRQCKELEEKEAELRDSLLAKRETLAPFRQLSVAFHLSESLKPSVNGDSVPPQGTVKLEGPSRIAFAELGSIRIRSADDTQPDAPELVKAIEDLEKSLQHALAALASGRQKRSNHQIALASAQAQLHVTREQRRIKQEQLIKHSEGSSQSTPGQDAPGQDKEQREAIEQKEHDLLGSLEIAEKQRLSAGAALQEAKADFDAHKPDELKSQVASAERALTHETQHRRALEDAVLSLRAKLEATAEPAALERLEELGEELEHAERVLSHIETEAKGLKLLQDLLKEARATQKDATVTLVEERIAPRLALTLGEAQPLLDKNLRLKGVARRSEEPFDELSIGTREQLSILTRLAMAECFADAGHACSLVLDDALVYSDSKRLQSMKRILEHASARVQILLFTCRPEDYADLNATRFELTPARQVVREPAAQQKPQCPTRPKRPPKKEAPAPPAQLSLRAVRQ